MLNLLSVGAAHGLLVALFKWGYRRRLVDPLVAELLSEVPALLPPPGVARRGERERRGPE